MWMRMKTLPDDLGIGKTLGFAWTNAKDAKTSKTVGMIYTCKKRHKQFIFSNFCNYS